MEWEKKERETQMHSYIQQQWLLFKTTIFRILNFLALATNAMTSIVAYCCIQYVCTVYVIIDAIHKSANSSALCQRTCWLMLF